MSRLGLRPAGSADRGALGTRSRYSGASLGYQLAAPFAGGLAPIIALLLLNGKNDLSALGLSGVKVNIGAGSWQAVSVYILVLAAISFFSVLGLRELTNADISGETPEARVAPAAGRIERSGLAHSCLVH